jgi:hypothetical protein
VKGRQGPHAQGVGVNGQDLPGVGRVQVRLAAVAAGQPRDADQPEHAGQTPLMPGLHAAVPDTRRAGDLRNPLLASAVDRERGLQQPTLQLPARLADCLLPLPVIQLAGIRRRPASIAENCSAVLASAAASSPSARASLPSSFVCVTETETAPPVLRHLPPGVMKPIPAHDPRTGPGSCGPGSRAPPWASLSQPTAIAADQRRSPSAMFKTPANIRNTPIFERIKLDIRARSRPSKRGTPLLLPVPCSVVESGFGNHPELAMRDEGFNTICLCEFDERFIGTLPFAAFFTVVNNDRPAGRNEVVNCFERR